MAIGAAFAAAASRYDRSFADGTLAAAIGYALIVPGIVATSDAPVTESWGIVLLLAVYVLAAGALGAALGALARRRFVRPR